MAVTRGAAVTQVNVTASCSSAQPSTSSTHVYDDKQQLVLRPQGSIAGSWHHTPWWVCVLHDPYERVNFWSHFLPGCVLVVLGVCALLGSFSGGTPMAVFCACAATTHLLSAVTHVWPDDHALEKLDHVGIVALIVGTPLTAAMARRPDGDLTVMGLVAAGLLVSAFMQPLPRTLSFVALAAVLLFSYGYVMNALFAAEVVMYLAGAIAFIR
ncbi:hypothetical protein FOA52_005647 [Chlamydomonas sp. UWO 241]|nr:hypothetical protein FOA52_005647 [Chlamydomonas sp. UWO 241]